MAMKRWKRYRAAGLLVIFLYFSSPTSGCGPFFPQTYFITSRLPDYPLEPYAAGKIGIVLPTYARSYLVVAYRYFNGKPLTPAEQAAALKPGPRDSARARNSSARNHRPRSPGSRSERRW